MTADAGGGHTPGWLSPVTSVLALVGAGLSSYLTVQHYRGDHHLAGCAVGGVVDCAAVTTSAESRIAGVPVALLGLVYFLAAIPFLTPPAWRTRKRYVRLGRLAGAVVGLGMVLWLLYAELGRIHKICEYCSAVHLVTVCLFAVIAYGTIVTSTIPEPDGEDHPTPAPRG